MIIPPGNAHDGRIFDAALNVLGTIHFIKSLAFHGVFDRPKFRCVGLALGPELQAHGVRVTDIANRRSKEVGPFRDRAADEDAPCTTLAGQLLARDQCIRV